jgi:hypothetical protein
VCDNVANDGGRIMQPRHHFRPAHIEVVATVAQLSDELNRRQLGTCAICRQTRPNNHTQLVSSTIERFLTVSGAIMR